MASVVKRKKSRYWTACFTDRNGRQLKRSTKTTDRRQALAIALELERVERQARQGTLTTDQVKKVLSDINERINGDSLIAPPVDTYLQEWLAGVAARNSAATVSRYKSSITLFLANLGPDAKKPLSSITSRHIEGFLNSRLRSGAAPKTAVFNVKTLNTAFKQAVAYGYILKNPVSAVPMPKVESSERDIFTHEEIQQLLDAAPTIEWQTMILLGFFLGARLGDCAKMCWENVHPEEGVIAYNQQKTGKQVVVPMHYHIIEHLDYLSAFGTTGFLCPKIALKAQGGKGGLSEMFKRIMVKAGLDLRTVPGKGARQFNKRTFHSLRHSFNSALANAGVPEEIRMKLTGHASKAMNTRYTHLEIETLRKAVTSFPLFIAETPSEESA